MRAPYQILPSLLSLFLVRVDLTDLIPLSMTVTILKVYDGDTVLIGRGSFQQKLRLTPIDSPEKGQPLLGASGDAGEYSRRCLERLLKKNEILILRGHDLYGRMLGEIQGVSIKLIQAGCTTIYPHASFESRKEKSLYLRELGLAKRKRVGLWALGGFEQPKAWRKKQRFSKRVAHRR
jgi:endonuclease YncB( thermonuclease family)